MNFHQWLKKQESRQDPVGELARQLLCDPRSPFWSNRLVTYRTFLIYRDLCKPLANALEKAFAEWQQERRT